jgi:cyclopropane fatty-acyl-phospholipid synthase-like methyltransferase
MLKALGQQLRKPSGLFGRVVSRMMDARNRNFYFRIIKEMRIQKEDRIYEIGFGPGLGVQMIASNISDCTISGIDFSELMVNMASKRNKRFIEQGRVNLKYGDLITADTTGEHYDKIFCVNVIYFWKDLKPVFQKIHSMLSGEGSFYIFMTPSEELDGGFAVEFNKYSIEEVVSALKESGFKNVRYKLEDGYYIHSNKN